MTLIANKLLAVNDCYSECRAEQSRGEEESGLEELIKKISRIGEDEEEGERENVLCRGMRHIKEGVTFSCISPYLN